jgi:chromosome segregation ATPase
MADDVNSFGFGFSLAAALMVILAVTLIYWHATVTRSETQLLRDKILDQHDIIDHLKQEKTNVSDSLDKMIQHSEGLEDSVDRLVRQKIEQGDRILDQSDLIDHLKQQNKTVYASLDKQIRRNKELEHSYDKLTQQKNELEHSNDKLTHQKKELEDSLAKLTEKNKELEDQVEESNDHYEDKAADLRFAVAQRDPPVWRRSSRGSSFIRNMHYRGD